MTNTKTLLVMHHQTSVLIVLGAMLRDSRYTILPVNDVTAALKMAEDTQLKIDLAVMDILVPDWAPSEGLSRLLAVHSDMKILFVSGGQDDGVIRIKLVAAALNQQLTRIATDDLKACVDQMLGLPAVAKVPNAIAARA